MLDDAPGLAAGAHTIAGRPRPRPEVSISTAVELSASIHLEPEKGSQTISTYPDPAHPVPYRSRPVERTYDARGSRWKFWETEDQRFVDGRPDVAKWVSVLLEQDLLVAGEHQSQHRGFDYGT